MPRSTATNKLATRNYNAAVEFNGSTSELLKSTPTGLNTGTSALSFVSWIRPLGNGLQVFADLLGGAMGRRFTLGGSGGIYYFFSDGVNAANNMTLTTAQYFAAFKTNQWARVVWVVDATEASIYVNGVLIKTEPLGIGMNSSAYTKLTIGCTGTGTLDFAGQASDAYFANKKMDLADVQADYFNAIQPSDVASAWAMAEGAGASVTDRVGSNTLTATSITWTGNTPTKARKRSVNANMVKNGDFEYAPPFTAVTTGGNGWVIGTTAISTTNDLFGWYKINGAGTFAASFDSVTKYAGSYSMKLESTDATGRGRVLTAPFESTTTAVLVAQYGIPVQPSTDYGLSAFIKTAGANASSVRISAIYYTADGTQSGSANSAFQSSTQDFTQVSLRFTTASTTRFLVIKCDDNVATAAAHQTWFDNVTLTPVYPEGRVPANGNLVKNFDFEVAPTFVAAGTTKNRWIDGTAAGSSTNATYKWAINNTNTIGTNFAANFDTSEFHSGTASMKLSTTGTGTTLVVSNAIIISLAGVQTCIPAVPNVSYTYSYWMKTNYVSGDSSDGAYMAFRTRNAAGSTITTTEGTQIKTTTDWTQYTGTFTTGASTVWIEVFPIIQGDTGAGTLIMDAWFDDIYLAPTTNPGRIAIT